MKLNIKNILRKFSYNRIYRGKIFTPDGYTFKGVIVDTKELYILFTETTETVLTFSKNSPFILSYTEIYDRAKGKFITVQEAFKAWRDSDERLEN